MWDSTKLGEHFFNEIIAVPIDLNALLALKRSPLGDLYLWLTYTFNLKTPWPVLAAALPTIRRGPGTVEKGHDQPSAQPVRELNKITRALHYHTVTGGLVLSPSPSRIPPAQLQSRLGQEVAPCGAFGPWLAGSLTPLLFSARFSTKRCDFKSFPSVKQAPR